MPATRWRDSATPSGALASAESRSPVAPDLEGSRCTLAAMSPFAPPWSSRVRLAVALMLVSALLVGCGSIATTPPAATPGPFPEIAGRIAQRGIVVSRPVSGDAGCADQNLAKTAIAFDASGLDQPTPVRIYVYIFRDRATYERLRATVDDCARTYVTDPGTYETVETSPYVLSGQGPWAPNFKESLRAAIVAAAGTGD